MEHPYDKKNYQIWRSVGGYEFRAICVDQHGEPAFDVHEDTPDDEIWNILFWIRHAYENGVRDGKSENEKHSGLAE